MATQMVTAMATPTQTCRRASRRPCWPKKAATIPTIRAASMPSRSPMTKVGSISQVKLGFPNIREAILWTAGGLVKVG